MLMTLSDAFARAFAAERNGDARAARAIYGEILSAIPEHPGALLGMARQLRAQRDRMGARDLLVRAIASAQVMSLPRHELWVERGELEWDAHDLPASRSAFASALADAPQFVPALLGAGNAALSAGDFPAAEGHFRAAHDAEPSRLAPQVGLAQALAGMRRFAEAAEAMRPALAVAHPDTGTRAAAAWIALQSKDWKGAQAHCRAGLAVAPRNATLSRLLGQALRVGGAPVEARRAFEAAVAADPDDLSARVGLSATLLDLGLADEARTCLETALAKGESSAEAFGNLGLAWLARGDYERAAAMLARAVDANPLLTPALADLVYARQYLCEWDGLDALEARLAATLDDPDSDPRLSPFVSLALHFTPAQQLAVARRWSREMLPAPAAPPIVAARGDRLRIGYLSRDFRDHPTGRTMAGLIEAHDRRRVEVFGYSYGPATDSPLRRRIVAAFDHWRDVDAMSDHGVAAAIRADRIDVLIDRKGHTHGGRLAALAERPASVQLHYMSFPGTLGYDAIDGLIADETVVPRGDDAFFHERVFRLPRCYFVTDGSRDAPDPARRADHGLPDDAVVLASLNQTYKITRDVFAIWIETLRAAPRAVLWLYANHPRVQANLRAEAARQGVADDRLVFAPSLPQDAHIARLRCADLSLDTLPCGSHTTAVDALWAGVPMLTCRGATFAGRVGASLLAATGLADLITDDLDDYRRRLLELVRAPERLREYSAHLNRGRRTLPLWDTHAFAADFERLLERAYAEVTSAH
ncbi:MAG: tetratricopeptide repeat protein [Burkholderiales bacterium]